MIGLSFAKHGGGPFTVLCLGAHSDDIEIGCGGTLLRLKEMYPAIRFYWVVFSATGPREEEAKKGADLFTAGSAAQVTLKSFRDGFLPYLPGEVKDLFEQLKEQVAPDLIFTHSGSDAHQDHRLVCELTWSTFRNHLILEYEIPKYDGDLGRPNIFVPLDEPVYTQKLDYLLDTFRTQSQKHWFRRDTFLGLMRLRGMEACAPSGYAEAFCCRKALFAAAA